MFKLKLTSLAALTLGSLLFTINVQASDSDNSESMPPKPVENKVFDAMVGKWEANSDMMGKMMHDKLKIKWDLNHQFLIMDLDAKSKDKPKMKYEGMGVFGLDTQGKAKTWWFDSWGADNMSTGSGDFGDNKLTITDSNSMFSEVRTFEIKGDTMVMHAVGTVKENGKDIHFDNVTTYKK